MKLSHSSRKLSRIGLDFNLAYNYNMGDITADGILGKPREGFHKERTTIGDFALNDILATVIGGIVISKLYNISIIKSVIGLFLFGEFLHIVLGIKTQLVEDLISQFDV